MSSCHDLLHPPRIYVYLGLFVSYYCAMETRVWCPGMSGQLVKMGGMRACRIGCLHNTGVCEDVREYLVLYMM